MEAKVHSKWSPIIRCDRSHDFLHFDLSYKNGRKEKLKLGSCDPVSAIIEVIEILKQEASNQKVLWMLLYDLLGLRDFKKR